jgi:hypothetical protein
MTIKTIASLGSLAAAVLLTAAAASAETVEIRTTASPTTRQSRPFTLSAVGSSYLILPMVGIEAEYQLTDRFALGARLSTLLMVGDASVNARYFFRGGPTSGVFAELSAHTMGMIMGYSGQGGAAEIGYEHRSRSGFTLGISGGLTVLAGESCGCRPPSDKPVGTEWAAFPALNLRMGYAF